MGMFTLRSSFGAWVFNSVLVASWVGGCSSDVVSPGSDASTADAASDTASPPDAGPVPDSSVPGRDSGGACNAVVNGASVVGETAAAGAIPPPAGGTIADGTYYLTKHEIFAPSTPDANSRKRTIVFAGNTVQTHENDTGRAPSQNSGTYTVSGSNITFTITCPISATVTIPYTATATTFATYAKSPDSEIFTSTKQ